MSYATVQQVRVALKQDAATPDADIYDVLEDVHSMITEELGFVFDGAAQTRTLDTTGNERLWLAAPGAASISAVVEDGATLDPTLYELDPEDPRLVVRLDSTGKHTTWPDGFRTVTITYKPQAAPRALIRAEQIEAVRMWRSRSAGYMDTVNAPDGSDTPAPRVWSASTYRLLETLKERYGSRREFIF